MSFLIWYREAISTWLFLIIDLFRFLSRYRIQCILGPGLIFILVHTLLITNQNPQQVRQYLQKYLQTCSNCFVVLEFKWNRTGNWIHHEKSNLSRICHGKDQDEFELQLTGEQIKANYSIKFSKISQFCQGKTEEGTRKKQRLAWETVESL